MTNMTTLTRRTPRTTKQHSSNDNSKEHNNSNTCNEESQWQQQEGPLKKSSSLKWSFWTIIWLSKGCQCTDYPKFVNGGSLPAGSIAGSKGCRWDTSSKWSVSGQLCWAYWRVSLPSCTKYRSRLFFWPPWSLTIVLCIKHRSFCENHTQQPGQMFKTQGN